MVSILGRSYTTDFFSRLVNSLPLKCNQITYQWKKNRHHRREKINQIIITTIHKKHLNNFWFNVSLFFSLLLCRGGYYVCFFHSICLFTSYNFFCSAACILLLLLKPSIECNYACCGHTLKNTRASHTCTLV